MGWLGSWLAKELRGNLGFEDIGVEDGQVRIVTVFALKQMNHRRIEFDGDDVAGLFGQETCEDTGTRPDLKDGVIRRKFGGFDNFREVMRVAEKVLP